MRPAGSLTIVGLLAIQLRSGPGVPLELEDFDPEARLWHDLEGPATQRLKFDILHACPMLGDFEVVPRSALSQARRPAFLVSDGTIDSCRPQVDTALGAWRQHGCEVRPPNFAMTFPPALALLMAHRVTRCFEVSAFRKIGQGVDLAGIFADGRRRCAEDLALPHEVETPVFEPKAFASLAMTLQGWLGFIGRGAATHQDRQEAFEERNMWSRWLPGVVTRGFSEWGVVFFWKVLPEAS